MIQVKKLKDESLVVLSYGGECIGFLKNEQDQTITLLDGGSATTLIDIYISKINQMLDQTVTAMVNINATLEEAEVLGMQDSPLLALVRKRKKEGDDLVAMDTQAIKDLRSLREMAVVWDKRMGIKTNNSADIADMVQMLMKVMMQPAGQHAEEGCGQCPACLAEKEGRVINPGSTTKH